MFDRGEFIFRPSGKSRRSYCCGRTYLEVVLLFVSFICSGIAVALVIVLATRPGNETSTHYTIL